MKLPRGKSRMLKRISITALLLILVPSYVSAETLFLKDGSIIKGKIIEEDDSSMKVVLPDGAKKIIKRENLIRTTYTDYYMGRVKIKKRDGIEIEAYIIDEDRESYILRWNLNKTDEFKLMRSEILQISRTEPSSLKAEMLKDRINLAWEPPFSKVKEYRVYCRSGHDKYLLIAVSKNEKSTIFGLKEKIQYTIIVKAVDMNGSESEPSNELQITLTDLKPEQPSGLTCETRESSDSSSLTASLKWNKAETGKKIIYRIYKITPGGEIIAGETTENQYMVYALSSETIHGFYVTAVDGGGNTSDRSKTVYTKGSMKPRISIDFSLLLPFGRLGELCSMGYGANFSFSVDNPLINYLRISAKIGVNYFQTTTKMFDYILIIPVTCDIGYSFYLLPNLYIIPELGAGASYNIIRYDSGYKSSADVPVYSNHTSTRPVFDSSLSLFWRIAGNFELSLRAGYMVIKDSSLYHFASLSAAAAYRF